MRFPRAVLWPIACIVSDVHPSDPELSWDAVKDILGYFLRNPQTVDSVEGVARWRVMEEQVHRTVEQTQSALGWLLSEGYLEELQTASAGRVFRLNPERQAVAARIFAKGLGKAER